jgi:hypothetical protein
MGYRQTVWATDKKPVIVLVIMRACTYEGALSLILCFLETGAFLGGHVRAVFTLITFIFTICVALTVTSFKEIPLHLLERQQQVRGDHKKREGLSRVNAAVTGTDNGHLQKKSLKNSHRCW